MSTETDTHETAGSGENAASRPPARPYWIGVLVSAMGALWFYGAMQLPQGARYAFVGPGLMVSVVGAGLFILGIILIIQIARGERFEPQEAEDAAANAPMDPRSFFVALAGALIPVATMPYLGLPATTAIAFPVVCHAFGSRKWLINIVTGAILGSVAWFLFTRLGLQLGPFFVPLER